MFSFIFQLQCIFHPKNQHFSLCSLLLQTAERQRKNTRGKRRGFAFSPLRLNGSIPPMDHVSSNPSKVDLGSTLPAGATCPPGNQSRRLDEHRSGGKEEHFGEACTHITHFIPWCFSFLYAYHSPSHKAVFEKLSAAFLTLHQVKQQART